MLYLVKHTSDCMLIGNQAFSGSYYLSVNDDDDDLWINLIWSDSSDKYKVTISNDCSYIKVDQTVYSKVKDL